MVLLSPPTQILNYSEFFFVLFFVFCFVFVFCFLFFVLFLFRSIFLSSETMNCDRIYQLFAFFSSPP